MKVERVEDETGSHIEPPLDQKSSPLEKLRWHAAVLEADTGALIGIAQNEHGFGIGGDGWGVGPMTFDQCWTFINGYALGIRGESREGWKP